MWGLSVIIYLLVLINLTLIGGILPLIERKYLSLIQRRVGPKFVGYKGRLQFIADALKLFLKGCTVPSNVNKFFFFVLPALVLAMYYFFWVNSYWTRNVIFFEIEYNLIWLFFVEFFVNVGIILLGYYSKNKYAFIGSIRAASMLFAIELLYGIFMLFIVQITNSLNISLLFMYQEEIPLLFYFTPLLPFLLLFLMLEVNKSPFDLSEAETELVTGYHTEYGSFFFGLYYLGEYIHIFFGSHFLVILLWAI